MTVFELPDPHRRLVSEIGAFAGSRLAVDRLQRAHETTFPHDVARLLAGQGWSGLAARPAKSGGGILAGAVAVEAVARVCPRGADALHQMNFGPALLLSRHGTNESHDAYLESVLAGNAVISIAITEEEAGAQAAALQSRVVHTGKMTLLRGGKKYAANSCEADAFVVYARFGEALDDIGALIVDRGRPGLEKGEPVGFMSGERWCRLEFRGLSVAEEDVLFRSGGFTDKGGFFDLEKIGNAARALGLGWCAFDASLVRARERRQFGRPVCEFQGLQWRFAEARLDLEAAQLMLYRAAARADHGGLRGEDASSAKILCNRAAMAACDLAVQVAGAAGYSEEGIAEYCYRKARGYMINGGVVELMLTRVAEAIFDRRFPQQPA